MNSHGTFLILFPRLRMYGSSGRNILSMEASKILRISPFITVSPKTAQPFLTGCHVLFLTYCYKASAALVDGVFRVFSVCPAVIKTATKQQIKIAGLRLNDWSVRLPESLFFTVIVSSRSVRLVQVLLRDK